MQKHEWLIMLVWKEVPEGRRLLGRTRLQWKDNLKSDLMTLNMAGADKIMMDCDRWSQIVK